jgi:hypothetical protein
MVVKKLSPNLELIITKFSVMFKDTSNTPFDEFIIIPVELWEDVIKLVKENIDK